MKKRLITGGIIVSICIILTIIWFSMKINAQNKNERLKAQIVAQQKSNEANFDKMKKVIKGVAETAKVKMDMSTNAFKEIYPALMEGRYNKEKDGMFMKWIQESNPQFDLNAATSLYDKLSVAIESNRQEFFNEQQKLIDYNREQHTLLSTFPSSMFLDKKDTISITIITSYDTKKTFASGEENDTDIFKPTK